MFSSLTALFAFLYWRQLRKNTTGAAVRGPYGRCAGSQARLSGSPGSAQTAVEDQTIPTSGRRQPCRGEAPELHLYAGERHRPIHILTLLHERYGSAGRYAISHFPGVPNLPNSISLT